MDSIKYQLENTTGLKVDVVRALEFLKTCQAQGLSQTAKERSEKFFAKWSSQKYVANMMFAYVNGSWIQQSVSRSVQLANQPQWEDYLHETFKVRFFPCKRVTSTLPETFDQLLQCEFWKELYEDFGEKLLTSLLKKSLVLFQLADRFLYMLSLKNGVLWQKLHEAINAPFKLKKAKKPDALSIRGFNPYSRTSYRVSNGAGKPDGKTVGVKRKRSTFGIDENRDQDVIPPPKAAKTSVTLIPSTTHHQNNSNATGILRWFRPSDAILKVVVDEREKLKRAINAATKPRQDDLLHLNFIGIMEDSEFRKKSKKLLIMRKHSVSVHLGQPLDNDDFKGLQIKEPEVNRSPDGVYMLNVYIISENCARRLNVRVKPKQRRRKKNATVQSETVQNDPAAGLTSKKAIETPTHSMPNLRDRLPLIRSEPYNPLMTLSTSRALYSKASWPRWPPCHIFSTSKTVASNEGASMLLNEIKNTNTGTPISKDISKFTFNEESNIGKILHNIVLFHQRVHDIHGLVKRSLTYWMIKHDRKGLKKERKKIERRQWRSLHPKDEGNHPTHQNVLINPFSKKFSLAAAAPKSGTMRKSMESNQNSSLLSVLKGSKQERNKACARLKERIPYSCISMTLKQVLQLSGINSLLGSQRNVNCFHRFVRKAILLGGMKSSLQLGQLVAELDPEACGWSEGHSSLTKTQFMAKIAIWVFNNYVVVLLNMCFYVTETNTTRQHGVFFLRESWKSSVDSALNLFERKGIARRLGRTPIHNRKLLTACRFLPKTTLALRPIVTYKQHLKTQPTMKYAVLDIMRILEFYLTTKIPHRFSYNDALHERWTNFVQQWRHMDSPKLYFVRGDVQDAFPSVDKDRLKKILQHICDDMGEVVMKKFALIGSKRVFQRRRIFRVNGNDVDEYHKHFPTRPCILAKLGEFQITPTNLFKQFYPYNEDQYAFRVGNHKFSFERGLPQGWILSQVYCNIYYGVMDLKYFSKFLGNSGEFFMTTVDDYLYITPDHTKAKEFLKTMKAGVPEYNCTFNWEKVKTNLVPDISPQRELENCALVNFCGWNLCASCGHVMRDFSMYSGQDIASTISFLVRDADSPERFLQSRMQIILAARFRPFLFDPRINCKPRVILTIWEAGILYAFRLYAICRVLYPNLHYLHDPDRAGQVVAAIKSSAVALCRSIMLIYQKLPNATFSNHCSTENLCRCTNSYHKGPQLRQACTVFPDSMTSPLSETEITYLIYHGFTLKLKKHSSVFGKEVLPRLYKLLHAKQSLLAQSTTVLFTSILDENLPPLFQSFKI